ncbi:response regulator [Cronbergia sp. UHCC 0137]|uniref:response regulator n=1 Tax=Cronbergia sp. UHCC 0137 TaxID=3110239 RepID=UPI002B21544C|nr:response regulator [Cronbergia sp. UHCC 0137]MEA5617978.1 response regulator [Cronbergia sp. UHCC 0137]
MNQPEISESFNLVNNFKICTQLQYNGQLIIKNNKGVQWTFYYRLGRLVWATGGTHPFSRWRRQMAQHCPQIDVEKMRFRSEDIAINYWDYNLLEILYKRQKIQREQIQAITENTIAELLFDLALELDFTSITCLRSQEVVLNTAMSFTNADISIKEMQESWDNWKKAGLANISPNLAPVLRRSQQLEQVVSQSVYKNFVALINGRSTLRELAMRMKQDTMPVVRSLLPYILKGIIELVEVPDLPLLVNEVNNSLPRQPTNKTTPQIKNEPLIACVDDSPLVCNLLEKIITTHGLRFIKVLDPVQALPILIHNKPDLIFLDLVMPVASGYEICTQLRRIPAFANTPVIILTSSDGLVDRVRAKVVGSTDFMSKPIVAERVMNMVRKYLSIQEVTGMKKAPLEVYG